MLAQLQRTLTVTCDPLIVTVTPLGIGTGCLPIRDSLHSIAGLSDREDCTLGCCGLKAATLPLKLLCMQCVCVITFRLRPKLGLMQMLQCRVETALSDARFAETLPRSKFPEHSSTGSRACAYPCKSHNRKALWVSLIVSHLLESMATATSVPMADTEYVKRMMGDTLAKGCAATIAANPTDPVEYLGQWLMQ